MLSNTQCQSILLKRNFIIIINIIIIIVIKIAVSVWLSPIYLGIIYKCIHILRKRILLGPELLIFVRWSSRLDMIFFTWREIPIGTKVKNNSNEYTINLCILYVPSFKCYSPILIGQLATRTSLKFADLIKILNITYLKELSANHIPSSASIY